MIDDIKKHGKMERNSRNDCILFVHDYCSPSESRKLYKRKESLAIVPVYTFSSPEAEALASTDITLLEFGVRALSKDLISSHTFRTISHRDPCDGELRRTLANLLSIRRADGLASCGACAGGRRGGRC